MMKSNIMYCVSYRVNEVHVGEDGMAMRGKGGGHSLK
jgi:hypothetical protein